MPLFCFRLNQLNSTSVESSIASRNSERGEMQSRCWRCSLTATSPSPQRSVGGLLSPTHASGDDGCYRGEINQNSRHRRHYQRLLNVGRLETDESPGLLRPGPKGSTLLGSVHLRASVVAEITWQLWHLLLMLLQTLAYEHGCATAGIHT